MLQGVAGGAADFLQPIKTRYTGSICILQCVAGGASNFLQPLHD